MSSSRSGNIAYAEEDERSSGGQRWDRDRFERVRARSRGPSRSSESFQYEESDRYSRGEDRRSSRFEYDEKDRYGPQRERAPPEARRQSRFIYEEDDRAPPARTRPAFLDERVSVSGREVVRRDREREGEKEYEKTDVNVRIREDEQERPPAPAPPRPRPARRRSSVDSYDRKHYEDRENINLEINVRPPPAPAPPPPRPDIYDPGPRYPRPPRPRSYYDEYEEEDFRYRRERDRSSYRRSFESSESFEEVEVAPKRDPRFKRGKTRMPKRLVHKRAIVELGCPFVEEEFFYIVQVALGKEQIDDIIKISENYKETSKETLQLEAPPPRSASPPPAEEKSETKTTLKIIENPTPSELARYKQRAAEAEANGAEVIQNDEIEEEQEVDVNETSSTTTIKTGRSGTTKTTNRSKDTSRTSQSTPIIVAPSKASSKSLSYQNLLHNDTRGGQAQRLSVPLAETIRSPSPTKGGRRGRSHATSRGDEIFEEKRTITRERDEEEEDDGYETETRYDTRFDEKESSEKDFHERFRERDREVEYDTETIHDDYKLGAPMTMVVRDRSRSRGARDLKAEIRALDEQRRYMTSRRNQGLEIGTVEDDDFEVVKIEERRDRSRHRSKSRRRSILGERLRSKSRHRHREPWVDEAKFEGDYDYEIVERKDPRDLFADRRKSLIVEKDVEDLSFETSERRDRGRDYRDIDYEEVDIVKVDKESSRAKSRDRKAKRLADVALLSLT